MSLPPSYVPAGARCVTPVDVKAQRMGIAFDADDGTVIRLAIDLHSANFFLDCLNLYLRGVGMNSQSPESFESPSEPKSVPDGGENV